MARPMRVRKFTRRSYGPGVLFGESTHQKLQEKRWWGWKTIDEELVPDHVMIEFGCLGGTGWRSKFAAAGSFGRDGAFTPNGGARCQAP